MSKFFLKADEYGYYSFTQSGKIVMIVVAVLLVILSIYFAIKMSKKEKTSEKIADVASSFAQKIGTKKMVVCAICLALAYVCSSIKFFEMPYGGSITLFSMLFVTYIGYCFGVKTGVSCGLAYGILQLIQDPWLLSPLQVCFDYLFAFALLGFSGFFRNLKTTDQATGEKKLTKVSLIVSFVVAAVLRGISHVIGGYMFWMDGMPDNFPKALKFAYPVIYNFSFIGAEIILTVVLLLVPGVAAVLIRLRREANA